MDEEDAFAPSLPFPPIDTSAAAANKNEGGGGGTQGVFEKGGPDRCVYLSRPLPLCSLSSTCCFSRCCRPPYLGARERPQTGARRKGTQKDERYDVKEMGALFRPTYCPSRPPRVEPGSSGSSGASRRRPIVHLARRDPEERGVFQERRDVYLLSCRRLFFV